MSESNGRDPNQSRDWMRQIQRQMRRMDEERGVLGNLCKRAKAAGENVTALKRAVKASKLTHEEAVAETRDEIYYKALHNIPVTQQALFSFEIEANETAQREDRVWEAQEAGYKAGRTGVRAEDNPHTFGDELFDEWRRGWGEGQAAIARELGPDAHVADASRARPRRKQAAPAAPTLLPYELPQETVEVMQEAASSAERGIARMERAAHRKKAAKRKVRKDKGVKRGRRNGPEIASDGVPVY